MFTKLKFKEKCFNFNETNAFIFILQKLSWFYTGCNCSIVWYRMNCVIIIADNMKDCKAKLHNTNWYCNAVIPLCIPLLHSHSTYFRGEEIVRTYFFVFFFASWFSFSYVFVTHYLTCKILFFCLLLHIQVINFEIYAEFYFELMFSLSLFLFKEGMDCEIGWNIFIWLEMYLNFLYLNFYFF